MGKIRGMHVITGKTKILGVIGAPIAHSLSPIIQNAALHEAGLDYVYTAFPVQREALASAVCGLRDAGVAGFNVTIPFKTEIMLLLDALSEDAQRIRAVNTVVIAADGKMTGHNTDVTGFLAGFAALGVRNLTKGEALCTDFAADGTLAAYCFDDPRFRNELCAADIVVQTTPIGMSPQTDALPPVDPAAIRPSAAVYDLIYTPAETAFLRAAAAHGCTTINGETMLVMQGAEAFYLWTGVRPNTDLMQRALREELARRG